MKSWWGWGLGAAGALALLLLWFALSSRPALPTGAAEAQSSKRSLASRAIASRAPSPSADTQVAPIAEVSRPVIDEVIVEKPEPCNGEETLVTVRAHTPDDTDAELHYLIGPGTGQSVPLRAWLDEQGKPPEFQLTVFGKDNVSTTQALPPLHVRPCRVGSFAVLSHRSLPNRWGMFEFRAQLREAVAGEPARSSATARARRYSWSFGDGTSAETTSGEVTHSYEDRPQQSLYSQFLVRVAVATGSEEPLVARDALQLPNPAYESWSRKGIVSLMVTLEPTFPTLSASGRVEQGVRLRHYRSEPVVIESVRKVSFRSDGAGQSDAEPVDVRALLGTDSIPAGTGLDLHVSLDTRAHPEVLSVTYYLKGESAEGRPVVGSFSVMRPPPQPSADNSTPVTDPLLAAKIRRARERLAKEVVSDEDLARLERQGEFQDL